MRHAAEVEKPRRRAAGRPAGPPNPVRDEQPAAVRGEQPPVQASSGTTSSAAADREDVAQVSRASAGTSGHRRRQRAGRESNTAQPTVDRASAGPAPETSPPRHHPGRDHAPPASATSGQAPPASPPYRDDRRRGESSMERSLRALVSTRTTALSPTVAMRAREVARPSAAELAAAEKDLVIVRRYYVPPAPLPTGKKSESTASDRRPEPEERSRSTENRRGGRRSQRGPA